MNKKRNNKKKNKNIFNEFFVGEKLIKKTILLAALLNNTVSIIKILNYSEQCIREYSIKYTQIKKMYYFS